MTEYLKYIQSEHIPHWLKALIILASFLILALIVRILGSSIIRKGIKDQSTHTDSIITTLRGFLSWVLVLAGIYYSVSSLPVVYTNPHLIILLARALDIIAIIVLTWAVLRSVNLMLEWHAHRISEFSDGTKDITHQANTIRKVLDIIIIVTSVLYILHTSGVDISPLLASGAVGGLAVALAAQDTLSNLFAGFYLGLDRPIREGDFIQLEGGQQGYVTEIGWRNTRVRLLTNNVVVIPNAKLSQSVFTNFYLPDPDMSLSLSCGVSYDSDLQKVEDIVLDVATRVHQTVTGADTDYKPVVRWKEFGGSSINFIVILRVKEFGAQYALQSEMIKAIHKRFNEENINIPFPTQTVYLYNEANNGESSGISGSIEAAETSGS